MSLEVDYELYHVHQDYSGKFLKKFVARVHPVKKSKHDFITLNEIRFKPGDFLALSIQTRT